MNKRCNRTIIIALLACMIMTGSCLAKSLNENLNIPAQLGSIRETYQAPASADAKEPLIIHIQDAHCNYDAQKNLAGLLEYLAKELNLRLILVEGGSGNLSLSLLRTGDQKARQDSAEKYLKAGEISGEEYLDMVSDYDLELYGIEDRALYEAHLAAFMKVDEIRQKGVELLTDVSKIIEGLKSHMYSEELRQLERERKAFDERNVSLAEYCQYLARRAEARQLNLDGYQGMALFLEIARLEKGINFKEAQLQRNVCIRELAGMLKEEKAKELLDKSEAFKSGDLSQYEYYSFLESLARGYLKLKEGYPDLYAYIRYVDLSRQVNTHKLLEDIERLQTNLITACLSSDEQRTLYKTSQIAEVLTKLFNLEVTPQDYAYFKANRQEFLVVSWMKFLREQASCYSLAISSLDPKVIDANLNLLEEFYTLGSYREEAFIKNTQDKLSESDEKVVVLITGGFHTPGITRMLQENNYSYIVVAPTIPQRSDPGLYFSVLRSKRGHTGEAIKE